MLNINLMFITQQNLEVSVSFAENEENNGKDKIGLVTPTLYTLHGVYRAMLPLVLNKKIDNNLRLCTPSWVLYYRTHVLHLYVHLRTWSSFINKD